MIIVYWSNSKEDIKPQIANAVRNFETHQVVEYAVKAGIKPFKWFSAYATIKNNLALLPI